MQKKIIAKGLKKSPPTYNFRSFSLYFDLPLKAAAEKFGVRATAFKKRCRSIGIKHWPFRKVRSLKRSIEELARFGSSGTISEKQKVQLETYQTQLDMLMNPQTYGIESAESIIRLFESTDFEDCDDDDDDCSSNDEHIPIFSKSPDSMDKSYFGFNSISPSSSNITFPPLGLLAKNQDMNLNYATLFDDKRSSILSSPIEGEESLFASTSLSSRGNDSDAAFHEALEQMEYTSEKNFLDDFFVELSPIYECST